MTTQRQEGREAYAAGKPRHENPYDVNAEQWHCWMDGFDQAVSEAAAREGRRKQ